MNNPGLEMMVVVRLRQQADALQEKKIVSERQATKESQLEIATKEIDLAIKNYKLQKYVC